jgi:DNA excision repair protein ERCC-4
MIEIDPRKGGIPPTIIIDKREFRSTLPAKLYFDGFRIIPLFLEIGDYILSNGKIFNF